MNIDRTSLPSLTSITTRSPSIIGGTLIDRGQQASYSGTGTHDGTGTHGGTWTYGATGTGNGTGTGTGTGTETYGIFEIGDGLISWYGVRYNYDVIVMKYF